MTSLMTSIPSLIVLIAGLSCGGAWAKDRDERLTLSDRTTSAKGQLKGRDGVRYSFEAKPGQRLVVRLTTTNPSAYINVSKEGGTEALCQGSLTENVCTVEAAEATAYVVDVYLMRNAARRGESARYTLSIEPTAVHTEKSG
ncbi:hypothetical protein [Roseateles amylovorans]|uniref:DNA breaking-rejoining protein n=1 Tax=Roseateles amylovorans TaxID=2978473 RepID=A0ABY6AXJ3_9BURK|nr:hypothetical protein [Roseateles amylovorans]UXH76474.1 hypothetical protein N4261_15605 [Roseateles amylovorans]